MSDQSRRSFLQKAPFMVTAIAGLTTFSSKAGAARACQRTAPQVKGPFYPLVNQADKDSDLTTVAGHTISAFGEVVWIEGVVRDANCNAVAGVLVEIWQACATGRYNHQNDPNKAPLDPNFQYWGRAMTNANGYYRFKTILPGAYPADVGWMRPPHVHFRVVKLGYHELITQMYFKGETLNAQDRILRSLTPSEQSSVVVDFVPNGQGERIGAFDIQIRKVGG